MKAPYLFLAHASWAAIFWTSYIAFFSFASWLQRRQSGEAEGENRDEGSLLVIYGATFVAMMCAFAGPFVFPAARIVLPPAAVFIMAMMLFWTGGFLYCWSVLTLGEFFRTQVTLIEGQEIVTRGPYRIVRHPAYLGGTLVLAGIGLAMGNWVSLAAATLVIFAAYVVRIRIEERALSDRFGAVWEARRRQKSAIIPFVW